MNDTSSLAWVLEVTDRLLRSWWTVVAGLCLGLSGALLALHNLPKTYEATTKILVAPPKIGREFVKNTVNDDTSLRIAALKESVVSRPYLMALIDKAYGPQNSEAETQQLLGAIRSRIDVKVERFSAEGTGMFAVRFRDSDPVRAAAFANDLADLYIRENSKYRAGRALETTQTIGQLAKDVRDQLEAKEKIIAAFKSQHLYELPERMDANLRLLESRQRDLEGNLRSLESAQGRLQLLQAQLQLAPAPSLHTGTGTSPAESSSARLAQLEHELAALKSRYNDDHPEVKAKEREIQDLKASAEGQPRAGGGVADGVPTPPAQPMSQLDREIRSQQVEISGLQEDQKRIRSEIALYSGRIERAPQVQQQLEERTKGYDVLLQQYREYQGKVESAKGAQSIEEAQKGEQFEVMERAVPPTLPVKPIPAMILGVGIALGLFIFAGPVILLGFIRPTVQSEEALRAFVNIPVLVSIPRVETQAVKHGAVIERIRNYALSTASAIVLAATVIVLFARR